MLPPGCTIVREFPGAPATLEALVQEKELLAKIGVFLPDDYREDRLFPLLIFLQGGAGGDGGSPHEARSIIGKRGCIGVSMPLFKRQLAKVAADRSNYWGRMFLTDIDATVMWRGYAPMLAWLFDLIPNIDRTRCCMGGFSNGAHTTAVLLNRKFAQISRYFTHFLFIEGGSQLLPGKHLAKQPLLMLQGADWDKPWLATAHRAAKRSRADLTFALMPGVGHAFPPAARKRVRRWLLPNKTLKRPS